MARCPKTATEAFKRLDKRLSEEEKKAIREAEDMCEFHFGLGMWIRNYWFYGGEDENVELLLKELGGDMPVIEVEGKIIVLGGGDDFSSVVLEAYQKHLKENYG
jgi:hypothetical protein